MDSYPEDTLAETSNYCRNPDSDSSPWCVIEAGGSWWEACVIPDCTDEYCTCVDLNNLSVATWVC